MSKKWEREKAWADQFMDDVKRELGPHILADAAFVDDAEHNTDLISYKAGQIRVGVRIRRMARAENYIHQFTIRNSWPNGSKTELDKILRGWGDLFFYGFVDRFQRGIECFVIVDLDEFRSWYFKCLKDGKEPGIVVSNRGIFDSTFRAFDILSVPQELFKGHNHPLLMERAV